MTWNHPAKWEWITAPGRDLHANLDADIDLTGFDSQPIPWVAFEINSYLRKVVHHKAKAAHAAKVAPFSCSGGAE